jgi:hypothetical protein
MTELEILADMLKGAVSAHLKTQEKLEKASAALEWYASAHRVKVIQIRDEDLEFVEVADDGDRARKCLEELSMTTKSEMPDEIWTDINGYAARSPYKGGTKYLRADLCKPPTTNTKETEE